MSPVTTHVLDTSTGRPAAGVVVVLEGQTPGGWAELARGSTDADGRVRGLLPDGPPPAGVHRLRFATGDYFRGRGVATFYPEVIVVVEFDAAAGHYHVPLLVSPFGFSTYRGS
jgi:5-hydroxyisourate hydrolase